MSLVNNVDDGVNLLKDTIERIRKGIVQELERFNKENAIDVEIKNKWGDLEETTVCLFNIPETRDDLAKHIYSIDPKRELVIYEKEPAIAQTGNSFLLDCVSERAAKEILQGIKTNFKQFSHGITVGEGKKNVYIPYIPEKSRAKFKKEL